MDRRPWELRNQGMLALAAISVLAASVVANRGIAERSSCPAPVERQRIDRVTERDVKQALEPHDRPGYGDILVEVNDGAVRLTGDVPSQNERVAVLLAAASAPGTRVLIDDLRIAPSE